MALLDLDALRRAPSVVPDFVDPPNAAAIRDNFPAIGRPGQLPVEAMHFGPRCGDLIQELQSESAAQAFSENSTSTSSGGPQ